MPRSDQTDVIAFLSDPGTYGLSEPVKRIETNGAMVFLAGADVYKLKRPVRFPYMDFSTLPRRKAACMAEVEANLRNAPMLYLGAMPITRDEAGLHIDGEGDVVDWLVHLRRFDENATLDRITTRSPLDNALVDELARAVAAAHRRAPVRDGRMAVPSLRRVLIETLDELGDNADLFLLPEIETLRFDLIEAFEEDKALLRRRRGLHFVRRCHGDLHLRNIALIDNHPILFDAIEFNEALATTDILYDIAFLVMDLCERGLRPAANRLLNRYVWESEDEKQQIEGLALMPLFLSLRAAIRAKVAASLRKLNPQNAALCEEAHTYFHAARHFLDSAPPLLVAVGGLSGTGKSTLAARIAPSFGAAPGALHLRSDIERKHLHQVSETMRLPDNAYQEAMAGPVYNRLHDFASTALEAGRSVVVDATYQHPTQRQAIEEVARQLGVPFIGIWLEAPVDIRKTRAAQRKNDASDATVSVVEAQSACDVGRIAWHRLDASESERVIAEKAIHCVG